MSKAVVVLFWRLVNPITRPLAGFAPWWVLVETTGLKEGAKSRAGKEVLTTITGAIPGTVVRAILPSADVKASFPVTYRLTEDNELRDASISGPFYPGVADVTYDISVTTSSEPVSITLPE